MPSNLGVIGDLAMPLYWKPVVGPGRIVLPWQRPVDEKMCLLIDRGYVRNKQNSSGMSSIQYRRTRIIILIRRLVVNMEE